MLDDLKLATSLGTKARDLGHEIGVDRSEKRYALTCTCGFRTSRAVKRKTAFIAITEHIKGVVREDAEKQNPRPPVESRFIKADATAARNDAAPLGAQEPAGPSAAGTATDAGRASA